MQIALDTNILAYAEGVGDDIRCNAAIHLIERLPAEKVLLPAQTLGELFRILTGKAGKEAKASHTAVLEWADVFEVADSSWSSFQSAFDLVIDHHMQIWDALILSVAAENHCRLLISEDFQDGFVWRGITIVNPFKESVHPILETLWQKSGFTTKTAKDKKGEV
jgi:predicted nucleic acid-binding protein